MRGYEYVKLYTVTDMNLQSWGCFAYTAKSADVCAVPKLHRVRCMNRTMSEPGWSIILAFTFTFGILSGQIGFVSLAPVTKYVLIACYDHQIGNSFLEINTKIVFKFRGIITKFADPFRHSFKSFSLVARGHVTFFSTHFWHFIGIFLCI